MLVERNNLEELGRNLMNKAVAFALREEYGKAYEFMKEALDFYTCDCFVHVETARVKKLHRSMLERLNEYRPDDVEFNFVKAYLLCHEHERKYHFVALDAIENYLEVGEDEFGLYVKGRIYEMLQEPKRAIELYRKALDINWNTRLNYRIGKVKMQQLKKGGLREFYHAFVENPSSFCCIFGLTRLMSEQKIKMPQRADETNELLQYLASAENAFSFSQYYYKTFVKKTEIDGMDYELDDWKPGHGKETLPVIEEFVEEVRKNKGMFK